MEIKNPLYKNQGIHVITSIFTVDKGRVKVLLVRRKKEPYKDMWALVGGALYNNEYLLDGLKREVYEKSGIENIELYSSGVFDEKDSSKEIRMIAITYIGIIDNNRVGIIKETQKTVDADWFEITNIPNLAYNHNEVLTTAIQTLQEQILSSNILKSLFPDGFTIPEIQKVYETVLNKEFDRRNFRKKLLSLDLIEDTNKTKIFEGTKPAKLYKFKENIVNKNIF